MKWRWSQGLKSALRDLKKWSLVLGSLVLGVVGRESALHGGTVLGTVLLPLGPRTFPLLLVLTLCNIDWAGLLGNQASLRGPAFCRVPGDLH